MNVVLIGFSGSGKSTVGKLLAKRLGWEFVDTDERIEYATGKPIHLIFAEEGEASFRKLESEAVNSALQGASCVIAVGGGAVTDPVSRYRMRDGNLVLMLDAEVSTIHDRLATAVVDEPRPMLADPDPLARIEALKAMRDPIYREVAHLIVSTDELDVEGVVERIVSLVFSTPDERPVAEAER
ncbi:MAG TPA: shikimate kinase [Chloroflexota bacterium]|nr:shikimate kinase [Chloroflexota bacterium]